MALVTTVGGASSDSFATVAEYKLYWPTQLVSSDQATPTSFSDGDIEKALRMACVVLEGESYFGNVVYQTQALKWPRGGIYDEERRSVDSTTIPQAIKNAQCEIAYALLLDPTAFQGDALAGLSSVGWGQGELQVTSRGGGSSYSLPANVVRMLRGLRTGRQARVLRA